MLTILKTRFLANPNRHPDLEWAEAEARLLAHPEALAVLQRMEETGGEPDVIGRAGDGAAILFCDCAPETPVGRRSLCYDDEALRRRKKNPPAGSASTSASETVKPSRCGPSDLVMPSFLPPVSGLIRPASLSSRARRSRTRRRCGM